MKKKILFTFLACGLILTTACGKKEENKGNENPNNGGNPVVEPQGPTANTENGVISEVTIDGLKITNIALVTEGSHSRFNADVVNTNAEAVYVKSFDILLKDEAGNTVVTLRGAIDATIEPGVAVSIGGGTQMDLTNIKSVEYVRNY